MKRYLVFAADTYYPSGGWEDFRDAFNSIAEAVESAKAEERDFSFAQIVDLETMEQLPHWSTFDVELMQSLPAGSPAVITKATAK